MHPTLVHMFLQVQTLKDEGNKETALSDDAPKEAEKLGRLHFTLDYNFTDNTVRQSCSSDVIYILFCL